VSRRWGLVESEEQEVGLECWTCGEEPPEDEVVDRAPERDGRERGMVCSREQLRPQMDALYNKYTLISTEKKSLWTGTSAAML
jgi:hypothetical protein